MNAKLKINKKRFATLWIDEQEYEPISGVYLDTQQEIDTLVTIVENLNKYAALEQAARELIAYRKQAGAINFQLEKADDYIRALAALLEKN